MKKLLCFVAWLVLSTVAAPAQTYNFDPSKSLIEIHLGAAGAFGFMGHDHLIQTRIERGSFLLSTNPGQSAVELLVNSKALRVLDPELSARDRRKIQTKMESDRILAVSRFPSITFKSTSVNLAANRQLLVFGNLTIRGQTRPIVLKATLEQTQAHLRVTGSTQFKQTEFGIKPVSSGFGAVKVKDLMTITFLVCGDRVR